MSADPASHDPWKQFFGDSSHQAKERWCRVPLALAELSLNFPGLESYIILKILFATVGANPPVEYGALTQESLASSKASINGVAKALDILEASAVISSRKVGRCMEYRPNIESWRAIDERIVPDRYRPTSNSPEVIPLKSPGVLFPGQKKMRPIEEVCQCHHHHSCELGKAIQQAQTAVEEKPTLAEKPTLECGLPVEKKPTLEPIPTLECGFLTLDGISGQINFEDFSGALVDMLAIQIAAPIPVDLARQWFDRLRTAAIPMNVFLGRIQQRRQGMRSWPFITRLVDDVVRANEALADRGKPKQAAAAAAPELFPPAMIRENLLAWSEELCAPPGFHVIVAQLERLASNAEEYAGMECVDRLEPRLIELRSELVNLILSDDQVRASVELDVAKELKKYPQMQGANLENLRRQLTERQALGYLGLPFLSSDSMSEPKAAKAAG